MGHFPGFIGADIPGQGPKLILSVRRNTQFRIDPSGIAELTRPARERLEPVVPSGEFEFRTPAEVVKGLGLGFDAERSLELAVRQWIAEPDMVRFRKSLYQSLRSFAPGNYAVRNEIARRAQGLWKASRGGAWSRQPGREGEREVVQKASQMGLFGVQVSKPAPKTIGKPEAPAAAPAANKPPAGFTPIPGSTRGGYHKRVGAKFVYWYPDTGVVEKPHGQDAASVHVMHNIVHAALGGYQAEVVKVPPKPTPAPVEAAPPAAQPAPAPAPEPKRTVVIDKPPPGGWRPEDKVPPRVVAPVVVPQPPAVIPGPIVPQVAPSAFTAGFTVGTGTAGQRLADQAAAREAAREALLSPVIPQFRLTTVLGDIPELKPSEWTFADGTPISQRYANGWNYALNTIPQFQPRAPVNVGYELNEAEQKLHAFRNMVDRKLAEARDEFWRGAQQVVAEALGAADKIRAGEEIAPPELIKRRVAAPPAPTPPPAEGPKLVVPVKPAVAEEWGWKRKAREAAEAAARAAAGQTPQPAVTSKVEEAGHGEATPGTAAQGGAGHRRVVDVAPGGTGGPDKGARGASTAPGREASPEAVIERVDKLGANPPATETTGELGLDKREVPTPTPASRKEATTVAEKWLPPIREALPDSAVNFPVPQPIINSQGAVVDHIRTLFPHQKEGAERILQAWTERDGIILQDDAGLGKTNTALAALVAHGGKRNLIVVPTTNKEGHKASTWGPSAKLYGIELRAQSDVFEGKGSSKRVAVRGGLSATDPGYYIVSYDELTVPVIDPETGKQKKQPGPLNPRTGKRGKDIPMREPNPALQGDWDTISYDECHTMVGKDGAVGIAASAAIALGDKAKKVLYMSATPFTCITDMHYLTRLGNPNSADPTDRMFGNNAEEFANWAEYVGAVRSGNTVKNPPTWVPRVKVAAKLHVAGATIKRQASLEGAHSKFQQVGMSKLTEEQRQVFNIADAIFTMGEAAMGENIMGMWRTNWAKKYWETLKIPAAIELGKQALAEGKQVAIFSSYKAYNHGDLRKVPEKIAEMAEKLMDAGKPGAAQQMTQLAADAQALVNTLPAATDITTQLVDAFGGGDHVAEIHGNTTKKPGDEQKLYQEGHKRVAVCTQAKGGTGISLHDTSGERPRVQINLSLPWSGRVFDQVAGRSHRLGSKSETTIHWLMGDAESERKMASVVSDRLRSQGSLCSGDPDIRKDAGMLAAWEASNASSDSDDEAEDINTLEDLTAALEQDDEEKVLGSEKLVDIRGAFAQYAEQLASGRDLIGEAYRAVQDRKAHEASLAHARAAEQMRAGKNWHIVEQTFGAGSPGYFISAYPAQLPPEHPNHNPENRYSNVSSGFKRSTSEGILKPFGARWNTMENPSGGRRLHGYWVPQDKMVGLAEELGVHKRKVDLRTVMARAKVAETERVEAAKAKKEAADKRFEAELGGIADPHGRKAIMALREHTDGRFKAARYGSYSGKTFWHLTEDRPAEGDSELWTRRHDIEALGGSYRDFPMHGGKGYLVDEAQLPAVASRILGHEDWRKSLVVPDMALDRLLDRCRVRMRMQQTTRPGELIWCAEEVPEELHTRLTLTPPGWPVELLGGLAKGAGHKYIKRTPTGNVKRPWRYWYKLPNGEITSSADIAQGSKFKVAHGGQEGHFEVTGHDKDKGIVHVKHDESQQTAHIRERDLHRMVQSYHAKKTQEAKAAAGEKPAAELPRATMGDLGKNGYDEIHGFAQNADELHQQAALMSKPDREFAVIKQPGGFVLASKRAGQLAPGQVAAGSPEGDKAQAEAQKHGDRAAQIESKIQVVRRDPVTGEETLISGKPPAAPSEAKPAKTQTDAKADAKATQTEAPEAPKSEERKTKLIMRAGKDEAGGKRLKAVPAEYEVVEAADLIASHNPQSFEERSDYPKGVQERRYHEVEADRTKIDEIARNLEPSLMVNTNPDAINGAPIITEDNVVLGGNGRTMGMQRAYAQYPEQAQQLKDHLVRHARAFGHSSADIERMKHPILVRRIKAGKDPQTLSALGRRMNESLTQGLDPRSAEVALGKHYVNQAVMDSLMHHMDADESLSDFLLSSKSGAFVQQLEQSGIIDQFNKGEFVDQETGLLNEDGRHRVERVLAARIIPDAGLLSRMNQKARESIAKAVPYLSQMEAKGWDIKKAIELAVRADIEQRHDKLYDAKDPKAGRELYLAQTEQAGMGGSGIRAKVNGDEVARAMFDVIQDHMGVKKFPAAIKQVALEADRQHHDHGDQGAMFQREKVEPSEAIRHAFKLPGKKKTTAPAEEAAPKVRKPRRKKGEAAPVEPVSTPAPVAEPEAPGKGWETARRQDAPAAAAPALFGGEEPPEHVQAAQAREAAREYDRARGRAVEDEPPPPPPEDTRTLGMFGMAMPPTTWHKAEVGDGGLGRYVMHAITWEAKNLVRSAVGAARPGAGIDGARVLKRLRAFIQEQTEQDRDFARGIGAHPVNDATLRGLVQAAAGAHVAHLAKSLAIHSLWKDWCKASAQV